MKTFLILLAVLFSLFMLYVLAITCDRFMCKHYNMEYSFIAGQCVVKEES